MLQATTTYTIVCDRCKTIRVGPHLLASEAIQDAWRQRWAERPGSTDWFCQACCDAITQELLTANQGAVGSQDGRQGQAAARDGGMEPETGADASESGRLHPQPAGAKAPVFSVPARTWRPLKSL